MTHYRGKIRSLIWWDLKRFVLVTGRYEVQTFLAMVGLAGSNYVRGLPSNPYLNYFAVGILVIIIGVMLPLRRHPRMYVNSAKLILGGGIWLSATIASVVFLPFPLDFTKFFSFNNSVPQNLVLGIAFLLELALPGLWFRLGDLLRDVESNVVVRFRAIEARIDWDAIIREEEFSSLRQN